MLDFNINEYVFVKLNETGLAELKRQHDELKSDMPRLPEYTPPITDSEGYSKFQAWSLMNTFGHMMRPPLAPPFDTNIKFEVKEQSK